MQASLRDDVSPSSPTCPSRCIPILSRHVQRWLHNHVDVLNAIIMSSQKSTKYLSDDLVEKTLEEVSSLQQTTKNLDYRGYEDDDGDDDYNHHHHHHPRLQSTMSPPWLWLCWWTLLILASWLSVRTMCRLSFIIVVSLRSYRSLWSVGAASANNHLWVTIISNLNNSDSDG